MTKGKTLSAGRRLRYALETGAAYALYGFFSLLPLEAASALGGRLLRVIGPRLGISRVAQKNIFLAFPEKSEAERHDILTGMWENLGRVVAEYPHLHALSRNVEVIGAEYLVAAREGAYPAIFAGGHLANWEVNALSAKMNGLSVYLVYRRPNNPWVDGLLRHARNSGASGHIVKGAEGAKAIFSVLKNGGAIGMLLDQKLNEGIALPFFGHTAMTAPAAVYFIHRLGGAFHPVRVERLQGARFRVTIFPQEKINSSRDRNEEAIRVMTRFNAQLESWIRERPEQWLWLHRRWLEQV